MSTAPRHPLPPELRDELAERAEGQELAQVWELLALVDPVAGSPEANEVWGRVSAEIAKGKPILTPTFTPTVSPSATPAVSPGATPGVASPGGRAIPSITPRRRSVVPWAIAATLAVATGLGVWQSTPIVVEAPLGEQLAITLPDGSLAELNAGSSLEYVRGFRRFAGLASSPRAVKLDGEAYFSVVPSDRPFSVTTTDARITVLGTSFIVRAHSGEPDGTLVGVESGRVRVEAVSGVGDSAVELVAGQETQVRDGVVMAERISPVDMDRLMLWRQGGIALVNLPLDAIFRELERRYAVDIRLRDVTVGDERPSVYYPERPSIERVLNDLCTIRGLRFSRTSRGFDITPQEERVLPSP